MNAGLRALQRCLTAAAAPLVGVDLEQVRWALLEARALAARYACFAAAAADVAERVQRRVQRRYGHQLSLRRLLG